MKNKNKNYGSNEKDLEISVTPIEGEPQTTYDLVNKYGTYEIQPTAETQNEWPTIAQGCPENYKKPTVKAKIKDLNR